MLRIQTTGTKSGWEWWWLRGACCLVPGRCYQLQKTEENNRGPLHDFDLGSSHTPNDISDLYRDLRLLSDFVGFRLISGDSVDWEPVAHICWPCCFLIFVMQWPAEARASSPHLSCVYILVYLMPGLTIIPKIQIQIRYRYRYIRPASLSGPVPSQCRPPFVFIVRIKKYSPGPLTVFTRNTRKSNMDILLLYTTQKMYIASRLWLESTAACTPHHLLHISSTAPRSDLTALLTKKQTQTN